MIDAGRDPTRVEVKCELRCRSPESQPFSDSFLRDSRMFTTSFGSDPMRTENRAWIAVLYRQIFRRRSIVLLLCVLVGYWGLNVWSINVVKAAIANRDMDAATSRLKWMAILSPYSSDMHFLKARRARIAGELDEMMAALNEASRLGHNRQKVDREEVLAYVQSGLLAKYEQVARRYLVDPDGDVSEICEALINGFLMNYRLGDAEQLLAVWELDCPDDPQAKLARAAIAEQLRDNNEAVQLYQRASELAPSRHDIKRKLFIGLIALHRYQEAGKLLKDNLYNARDAEFGLSLATYYAETGKPQEARIVLEELAHRHPNSRRVKLQLAREYFRDGRTDDVMAIVNAVLKEAPQDYDFRYLAGQALSSKGDPAAKLHLEFVQTADARVERIQTALDEARDKPKDAASRFEIGSNLMDFGYEIQGVNWLRSVLELDPKHQDALRLLIQYYEREGQLAVVKKYQSMLNASPQAKSM